MEKSHLSWYKRVNVEGPIDVNLPPFRRNIKETSSFEYSFLLTYLLIFMIDLLPFK